MTKPLAATAAALTLTLLAGPAAAAPVPRIIGGSDASHGEFPFMAALVQPASKSALYQRDYQAQFCGGTVVGARWVLTAAHCVEGMDNSDLQVITGATTLADAAPFATRTNVAGIFPHPLYDEDKIANDIAMLYLATPVATAPGFAVDDGSLLPTLSDGADLTAIGWGITNQNLLTDGDDDETRPTLQKAVLDFVSFPRCDGPDYYAGTLHRSALCAGWDTGPRRDSCFGDSGGPLLLPTTSGWRQLGVTSYGATYECAAAGQPAVYVNVGQYNGFVSGIQSQPDLRTTVQAVSVEGIRARARIGVSNASPANSASTLVLNIQVAGDNSITDDGSLAGCTEATSGALAAKRTTYTCNIATLAANSGIYREISLDLYGSDTTRISASVSSTSGDYYAPNNSNFQDLHARPLSGGGTAEAGNLSPAALLFLLLALPALRRHAPHHSLRLRQLLRIG
jgi:secreted trypsin-like serine protease